VSSRRTISSGAVSLPFTRRMTEERFSGEKTSVKNLNHEAHEEHEEGSASFVFFVSFVVDSLSSAARP
jgi:hypothetical protein